MEYIYLHAVHLEKKIQSESAVLVYRSEILQQKLSLLKRMDIET